jgi:hypothetical protein
MLRAVTGQEKVAFGVGSVVTNDVRTLLITGLSHQDPWWLMC